MILNHELHRPGPEAPPSRVKHGVDAIHLRSFGPAVGGGDSGQQTWPWPWALQSPRCRSLSSI